MSLKPKLAQPDQLDIQIGIYHGLEWTQREIAEELNRTEQAIYLRRTGAKKNFIDQIASWSMRGAEKRLTAKLAHADTKRRISEKAYRNLEMLLERTEKLEDGSEKPIVDALLLAAVKEALDRTEGKAMDRKAILSAQVDAGQTFQAERTISDDDLDSILEEQKMLNDLRRRALPPAEGTLDVTEADLVGSEEPTN